MHIVHLTPFYSPRSGGVETHVEELCRVLVAKGHTCTVVTQRHQSNLPIEEQIDGVTVLRVVPLAAGKISTWYSIWKQRQLLHAADRVHVHDVGWWLLPLYWQVRKKTHTTFHGWETQWPIPWQNKLHRWPVAKLSRTTIHVGAWIKTFYWDTPTAVTYGGVRVPVKIAPHLFHLHKKIEFVFVGRLEPDNDIASYFSVIALLRQKCEVHVTWVGDGSLRTECKKFGTVTGWVDDVWPMLKKADLIAASSYLSLWQALACGVPVVACFTTTLKREYLRVFPAAELLFSDHEPSRIVEKVIAFSQDTTAQRAWQHKAQQLVAVASWENVAQLYLRLWGVKNE